MGRDTLMKAMLFDFYGELLTEKQREYYDLHYNEDLSLYEIAEQNGVSRQAVWDIIRRGEQTLVETERKTGLVEKAIKRRNLLEELGEDIRTMAGKLPERERGDAERIIEKLKLLAD